MALLRDRSLRARSVVAGFGGGAGLALAAIFMTLLLVSGPILVAGADPIAAYHAYFIVPLTSQFRFLEILVSATPLMFTGAAVAIAFRAGYWNIGVEGQLLMGAVAAAGLGMAMTEVPTIVALPVMLVAAALAGAAWALVPALLRVRLGIDEVVTTLLLNPVALLIVKSLVQGPWRDPMGIIESPPISETAHLPQLVERSRLHLGFVIALVILAFAWYVLGRTAVGLRVRAVGLAPHAARFAGIRVERTLLGVALVSGAVGGVAGFSEVAGIQFRLTSGFSPGFGYTGIVVAMLGGLTMPGVLTSALLLGDLNVGAAAAERSLGIPSQMGRVVQGALLLTVVGLLAVRRWRVSREEPPADGAEPEPSDELGVERAPE